MINIVIPLGGKSLFFDQQEYQFPKHLYEINGLTMIEWVIRNFDSVDDEKQFIFLINKSDSSTFHLDSALNLLCNKNCKVIVLPGNTKGATCSALLAIDYILNSNSLIIANGDQYIDYSLGKIIHSLHDNDVDGGLITFDSIHPKWSYVRLDESGYVVETSEKNPISKNAIAGFYYFKQGDFFVHAAMKSIMNNDFVDGNFYISLVYNQLILDNKKILPYHIDKDLYHSFYSPKKIKEFESKIGERIF